MDEQNIGTVTESAGEAESFNDAEFLGGLFDGETFAEEEETGLFDEAGETEKEETETVAQEEEAAESEEKPEEGPEEELTFVEHGKQFSVPKAAAERLAGALGLTPNQLIDIYQKGCAFDGQKAKLEAAKNDTQVIEKLAQLRGITSDDLRREINNQIEEIPMKQALEQIKRENPGISEETARELAKFRAEAKKPKAEEQKEQEAGFDEEETAARLREVEIFTAKHAAEGITKLPNEVIEIWEKSGIPLEAAYESFANKARAEELEKKIVALEKEKAATEQRNYAKDHSPGSSSSAKAKPVDEFVEGLFKNY